MIVTYFLGAWTLNLTISAAWKEDERNHTARDAIPGESAPCWEKVKALRQNHAWHVQGTAPNPRVLLLIHDYGCVLDHIW